jgi:hypothetical protein
MIENHLYEFTEYYRKKDVLIRIKYFNGVVQDIEEFKALVYPTNIQETEIVSINDLIDKSSKQSKSNTFPFKGAYKITKEKPIEFYSKSLASVDIDTPEKKTRKKYTVGEKETIILDLKNGLSTREAAQKNNVTEQTIYNVRKYWKRTEDYKEWQEKTVGDPIPEPPRVIKSNRDKVRELHLAGHSDEKIYAIMHDFMTDAEYREAIYEATGRLPENV